MRTKLIKVGKRSAVIIPSRFLRVLNIKIGDKVNVSLDKKVGVIVINKVKKKK